MSRNLKRVPLDFKWPMDQTWKGYLNPYHSQKCKSCDQTGLNPETLKIDKEWYSSNNQKWVYVTPNRRYNDLAHSYHITESEIEALIKRGRLSDFYGNKMTFFDEKKNYWYRMENGKKVKTEKPIFPTPEQVNEWNKVGFGHDGINKWICVETRAKELGVYGVCEFCNGSGEIWQSEKVKRQSDRWKSFDPPIGEGYQLWEDTSEGSPDSPVFATLEELCDWCEDNATVFADIRKTKEEWFQMLSDDKVIHQEGNMIFL